MSLANFTICLLFKTFVTRGKLVYTKLEICFSVFCFISDIKMLDSLNYQSKSMSCSSEPSSMTFFAKVKLFSFCHCIFFYASKQLLWNIRITCTGLVHNPLHWKHQNHIRCFWFPMHLTLEFISAVSNFDASKLSTVP